MKKMLLLFILLSQVTLSFQDNVYLNDGTEAVGATTIVRNADTGEWIRSEIEIKRKEDKNEMLETLIHELGHHMYVTMPEKYRDVWFRLCDIQVQVEYEGIKDMFKCVDGAEEETFARAFSYHYHKIMNYPYEPFYYIPNELYDAVMNKFIELQTNKMTK